VIEPADPAAPAAAPAPADPTHPVLAADTIAGGPTITESLGAYMRRTCHGDEDELPEGLMEEHVEMAFRLGPYAQKDIDFKMDNCDQHKLWVGIQEILDCAYTETDCQEDVTNELWGEKMEWPSLRGSESLV
jgi:hypothetical protein